MTSEKTEQTGFLSPMEGMTLVGQITSRLTNAILSGELKPGQQLPTEIELCESMQVGRNSVREAIKSLVAMGVLSIRRSEGTFVAEGINSRMLEPMVYGLILEGGNTYAMLELRRIFEVGILQMAVQKADEHDIQMLNTALKELERTLEGTPQAEKVLEADINFHDTLNTIVKNTLVSKLQIAIEKISQQTRGQAIERFIKNGETADLLALHKSIYDTVVTHDDSKVGSVVDEHYRYWRLELK